MTSFQSVVVDFDTPDLCSVVGASNWIESKIKEADKYRTILILRNSKSISNDALFVPLIDRWIRSFPGRVFLDSQGLSADHPITKRLPVKADPSIVYIGHVLMSDTIHFSFQIRGPCRPNRIPQSEFLFPIGRLQPSDAVHVPMTGNAKLTCLVEDANFFDLDHLLLATGPPDMQIFWLADARTLVPVQNLETVKELCREAKVKSFEKPTYLRSLAVNTAAIKKAMPKTSFAAVMSKKQLGAMKTRELLTCHVEKFFGNYRKSSVQPAPSKTSNFENTYVLKQLSKLNMKGGVNQSDISETLKKTAEEGDSYTELVLQGKRRRRLFGTFYNSHKWPFESNLSRDAIFDGPLLSEVVGELLL